VLVNGSATVIATSDLDGRSIVIFGTCSYHSVKVVVTFREVSAPSGEVTVLVKESLTWWLGGSVIRWATIRENFDGRSLIVLCTSGSESTVVIVSWSELSGPTVETSVLIENSTTLIMTSDLNGGGIIVSSTGSGHGSMVVLTFREVSTPSFEVTVLVEGSLTWFRGWFWGWFWFWGRCWFWFWGRCWFWFWGWLHIIRWATVRKDFDSRCFVIFGTGGVPASHVVVSWSELSGPSSEISMFIDNGTALFVTSDFNGRGVIISGANGSKSLSVIFSFSKIGTPSSEVAVLVDNSFTL
jgi:hypothetical protein